MKVSSINSRSIITYVPSVPQPGHQTFTSGQPHVDDPEIAMLNNDPSMTRPSGDNGFITTTPIPQNIPNNNSRRQKKKTATTKDQDLNVKFLECELQGAQARIAVLDSEIEDKDKRISLLQAHIKALEEKLSSDTYNKYFPNNSLNYLS